MYLGVPGVGCHLLTMPKYLFFTGLILKTISSPTSDSKKLIYGWSNFRFPEKVQGWKSMLFKSKDESIIHTKSKK